jgi:CRISPR-associated helicase Cas3, subtype CYANO
MSEHDPVSFQLAGLGLRMYPGEYPVDEVIPHKHQWALHDALTDRLPGLFVDDAPTGAGKTLAWLAPVVSEGLQTVAVYPTNALIEDQVRNIDEKLEDVEGGNNVRLLAVTSETLQNEHAEQFPSANTNGERLRDLLKVAFDSRETVILLTNPDIFVLLRREIYRERIDAISRFEVAVVDEFHRATRKERNTMLFLLDEMYETNEAICRLNHLVFLSATPEKELERQFEEAMGVPYYRVSEVNWRETPLPEVPDTEESVIAFAPNELPSNYRAVLPPVDLTITPAPTFEAATAILDSEDVLHDRLRDGRTVMMLDGVHEVDQVYNSLAQSDLNGAVRIDGFHRENVREKLDTFETLVSNSAVEVGVDFDTEQIIFSGHDAASFFQRLGRLRTRPNRSAAYAYVPPYLLDALNSMANKYTGQWIDRATFEEYVSSGYIDASTPGSFDWRYSAVEAYDHVEKRAKSAPSDDQPAIRETGWKRIERHFFHNHEKELTEADLKRLYGVAGTPLLDSLQTYRGDSIQTVVYNNQSQTLQTYSIPHLLRHGDVSFHSKDEFLSILPEQLHNQVSRLEPYSSGYCLYQGRV